MEVFYYIFFLFSLFPKPDYSNRPVLLIHGYFLDGKTTWSSLKKTLIENGYPEEYIFIQEFKDVFGCNPEHGLEIKKSVENILKQTGKDKIDIVAHSMGALDGRYYIKYLCGYKYVKNFISIAGANHGTKVACVDMVSCGAKDMCIKSLDKWQENNFLKEINSCDETPYDKILYTSIWSKYDEIIKPPESSKLDGALNIETNFLFTEHGLILVNKKVHEYVLEALKGGGKNDNHVPDSSACYVACENTSSDFDIKDLQETQLNVHEPVEDMFQSKETDFLNIDVKALENQDFFEHKFFTANRKLPKKFTFKGVLYKKSNDETSDAQKKQGDPAEISCSVTKDRQSPLTVFFQILFLLFFVFLFKVVKTRAKRKIYK